MHSSKDTNPAQSQQPTKRLIIHRKRASCLILSACGALHAPSPRLIAWHSRLGEGWQKGRTRGVWNTSSYHRRDPSSSATAAADYDDSDRYAVDDAPVSQWTHRHLGHGSWDSSTPSSLTPSSPVGQRQLTMSDASPCLVVMVSEVRWPIIVHPYGVDRGCCPLGRPNTTRQFKENDRITAHNEEMGWYFDLAIWRFGGGGMGGDGMGWSVRSLLFNSSFSRHKSISNENKIEQMLFDAWFSTRCLPLVL